MTRRTWFYSLLAPVAALVMPKHTKPALSDGGFTGGFPVPRQFAEDLCEKRWGGVKEFWEGLASKKMRGHPFEG